MQGVKYKPVIRKARVGVPGFSPERMAQFGQFLNNTVKERISKGLDIHDAAAPSLAPGYLKRKVAIGREGIRNLNFTGTTMRGMVLLNASTNNALLGFNFAQAEYRVVVNKKHSVQYGASPKDEIAIRTEMSKYMSETVVVVDDSKVKAS